MPVQGEEADPNVLPPFFPLHFSLVFAQATIFAFVLKFLALFTRTGIDANLKTRSS